MAKKKALPSALPAPISKENVRRITLARINLLQRITGFTDSQVGQRALNDTKFVGRIRGDDNFNMRSIDRLNAWMEKEWLAAKSAALTNG